MKMYIFSIFMGMSLFGTFSKACPDEELQTVAHVDLKKYMGLWYEIARLPQKFEKDCVGVTAEYRLQENGKVEVINTCRKNSCDATPYSKIGKAYVADEVSQSKLRVSFFWFFYGDYWILELGSNYEYAVVGAPNREYFWILSRTPELPKELTQEIVMKFKAKGFDLDKLEWTKTCRSDKP